MDFELASPEVETVVTLIVPEDAKVELAGAETGLQGPRRVFATKRLAKGQTWSDYAVSVSWQRDGQTITKQKSLTIQGGESYELEFGAADDVSIAALN